MTETGSSWEEFLNLRYYPDGYGKIPEKSFRQVHLDRLTPDQLQTMTQSGFCLKWHDSIGRPLIYHLVDTTCGLRPITPEVLDYLLKNGLSSNAYVTSFSESSVSLIEQIARDSHPIRRQDYLKCLFQIYMLSIWKFNYNIWQFFNIADEVQKVFK